MQTCRDLFSGYSGIILLTCQLSLAALATLFIVYAPRAENEPVLLYPLTQQAERNVIARLSRPGTSVISRGKFSGSYVVGDDTSDFTTSLFDEAVLVLRASAPGCSTSSGVGNS